MMNLELEAARSKLAAAQENRLLHENSMGDWALSGQMDRDLAWISQCRREVERLEALEV